MKRSNTQQRIGRRAVFAFALLAACVWSPLSFAAAFSPATQGYLFMHPFFAGRGWKSSLDRLECSLPADSLSKYRPQGFDVSAGRDSAMAVFSTGTVSLFQMPVRYEALVAPCLDHMLTFDNPRSVTLGSLVLTSPRIFHVLKDSVYSFDSLRVIVPSASVSPLKVYIATIKNASVTRIDSVTFATSRANQRILGVSGDPDALSKQDRGVWVTGSQGLLRYIPYTNHQWGAVLQRDLADTSTVLHTNGTFAGTREGRLYKKNVAGTAFVQEGASAGRPVWRVYAQGVIGDNGLFKENANGVWKRDTAFGTSAFRYANFIRRPGGFGVELLDSNWAYRAYTYRDTTTVIQSTTPASLMTWVNGLSYTYQRTGTEILTINLNDLDSNYSDYRLWLNGATDLKNDGTYTIGLSSVADTETCHIGTLKMTTGSVRLTLTPDSLKIAHDCVIGALNPTCLSCYWKKYTFTRTVRWGINSVVVLSTSSQTLRIANGYATTAIISDGNAASPVFRARFANCKAMLEIPLKAGSRVTGIVIHDLNGRQLASMPVQDSRLLTLPHISPATGVVIISCRLNDGSVMSRRIPVVR